jgi:tRNA(adenine34) deaminase
MEDKHQQFMTRCLELAMQAKEAGKAAVGAVVVKNDVIIAEGIEGIGALPPSLAHAEIAALLKALAALQSKDLNDCTLYTSVEPCYMCSYLIRDTKVSKVVFGAKAGEIGGLHAEFPLLRTTNIAKWSSAPIIIGGVLEKECLQVLKK